MIVPLMVRAPRPSRLTDMKAVAMPFWLRKGYEALTFFGTILTHSQQEADAFNTRFDTLKNHEMIHLYQARATHDSWLCFYWQYFVFWLKASRYRRQMPNAGYWLNPFELEAYGHMHDMSYLQRHPDGCTEWRQLARLPLGERLKRYRNSGFGQ